MTTTKQYLDLNGLKYLLSKLRYTKPASETGKFLTGLTESKGVISGTWANLTTDDIPAIGTPTTYSAATALTGSVATITNTITRDAGDALTASFKLGVSGNLSLTRADNGDLTIGYTTPEALVKGVKADGYLTLDSSTKLLDINADKIKGNAGGTKGLLAAQEYVDEKVAKAIVGGVQYKGTTATLPDNPANGDMWKLTTNIKSIAGSKAGDVIIYHTSGTAGWDLIPSGDDVEYTGIKVGDTAVVDGTTGGDATFAAGDCLSVAGKAGTVTYSHAIPSGAAAKDCGFYKIEIDKFGHVTLAEKVAQEDITSVLGSYVSTIGGQKGDITVNTSGAEDGSINFTIGEDKILKGTVAGWDTKQDAFEDGSAAIVTTAADSAVQTAGAENSTSTTIKSVTQTNGTIGASAEAVVEFKTISNKDIDTLFA